MSNEFVEKENNKKSYIIVIILYAIVIILTILFILGIKNQKDVVENNLNNKLSYVEVIYE